jgi:hypothetical protein
VNVQVRLSSESFQLLRQSRHRLQRKGVVAEESFVEGGEDLGFIGLERFSGLSSGSVPEKATTNSVRSFFSRRRGVLGVSAWTTGPGRNTKKRAR